MWNCKRRTKHNEVKPPNKRKSIKQERIAEREREREHSNKVGITAELSVQVWDEFG